MPSPNARMCPPSIQVKHHLTPSPRQWNRSRHHHLLRLVPRQAQKSRVRSSLRPNRPPTSRQVLPAHPSQTHRKPLRHPHRLWTQVLRRSHRLMVLPRKCRWRLAVVGICLLSRRPADLSSSSPPVGPPVVTATDPAQPSPSGELSAAVSSQPSGEPSASARLALTLAPELLVFQN